MTVICNGAEFNAFMTDPKVWKDDIGIDQVWMDDVHALVDGKEDDLEYSFEASDSLPPQARVEITGGQLIERGRTERESFEEALAKWLNDQKVRILVITAEPDKASKIEAYAREIGADII